MSLECLPPYSAPALLCLSTAVLDCWQGGEILTWLEVFQTKPLSEEVALGRNRRSGWVRSVGESPGIGLLLFSVRLHKQAMTCAFSLSNSEPKG